MAPNRSATCRLARLNFVLYVESIDYFDTALTTSKQVGDFCEFVFGCFVLCGHRLFGWCAVVAIKPVGCVYTENVLVAGTIDCFGATTID